MDAESKELLQEWLVRSLEPVCDADPEVLSKYVLALIQNDPQKEGLRETCVAKLEEFLGDETIGFVNRLFKAIETESYKSQEQEQGEIDEAGEMRDEPVEEDSRRRDRGSDDEDERRRYAKRRREDDRLRDPKRFSPRREQGNGRRQPFGPRDGRGGRGGGPGGPFGGRGDRMGYGMDRRRGYGPEWGMPPPMGMWSHPPYPPRGGYPPHMMPEYDPNAYNPDNPAMIPPPQMGMMMPPHMRGQYQPRGPGGRGNRNAMHGGNGGRGYDGGKGDDNRGNGPISEGARTTLRVSNVDPKFVNMTKLSLHFSKFGNVVNVQMRPNFKCAYVQYATEEEAKKAFHSPIPVCNNRFIEVKWAKYDAKDLFDASATEGQASSSAKENGESESGENGTVKDGASAESNEDGSKPEKEMTPEELRAAALEKGRKVLEEKRELLEKQKQLMKQKEELLKRQISQQKEILERMSQNSANVSLEDKRELLNKITSLSEELKALRGSVSSSTMPVARGEDNIHGLKAELTALEAQAAGGGRGRGRGGGRFAGRGGHFRGRGGRGGRGAFAMIQSHTLDNRTTIVKVANLPEDARDSSVLQQHFGNFGAVDKVVLEEGSSAVGYVKFQDRYAGQAALNHGKVFGDTSLEMDWVEPHDAPADLQQPAESKGSHAEPSNTSASATEEVQAAA